jgi:hypothetical protein
VLLTLGALGAAGAGLGALAGPEHERAGHGHGQAQGEGDAADHQQHPEGNAAGEAAGGLGLAEAGYRLAVERPHRPLGRPEAVSFRVIDGQGRPLREFETEHERAMHLILVRRDLSGFQHLHPRMAPDGTWTAEVALPEAGAWRLFADFRTAGRSLTLGHDLFVDGVFRARALPAPAGRARAGDYEVLLGDPTQEAGKAATLRFEVRRDGERVADLEPYLGARGHLVALREGDLAFLHVHPEDGATPGAGITFAARFPSPGRYRLFMQFRHRGRVHTAALTREVVD